jgi:hypothetical protein
MVIVLIGSALLALLDDEDDDEDDEDDEDDDDEDLALRLGAARAEVSLTVLEGGSFEESEGVRSTTSFSTSALNSLHAVIHSFIFGIFNS